MKRFLPFPVISCAILALWLLLTQSVAPGHLILGTIFALCGGLVLTVLDLSPITLRRPRALAELTALVLFDIVRSNIAVSRIILGPKLPHETTKFLNINLDMRSPYGLATLAIIITSTPGTLWVDYSSTKGVLTMHILDLVDEAVWIKTIKLRYERRLMEIFE